MKNTLIRKFRNNKGETIAETLVALLIAALGLLMLATAINSTVKIINNSNKKIKEYIGEDVVVAEQKGGSVSGSASFSTSPSYDTKDSIGVNVYVNDTVNKIEIISFKKAD
ncbi:MAG: hypothetical protein IK151_05600 [Erysipelotrichaceae bacterium]|nr:hypothetical protein [Erysipelotrichaceae bacterium]